MDLKLEVDIPNVYFVYFENVGRSGSLLQFGRSADRLLDGRLRVGLLTTLLAGDAGLAIYFEGGGAGAATAIHFVINLELLLNCMAKAEAPTVPKCPHKMHRGSRCINSPKMPSKCIARAGEAVALRRRVKAV